MKYPTLKDLLAAAKEGSIPPGSLLIVDNDCASMYGPEPADPDDDPEELWTSDHGPQTILIEVLCLLGLPAERP